MEDFLVASYIQYCHYFRYPYQQVSIESYVLDILREQLSRRQSMDGGSRNLLRVMTATCGYTEVRTMAVQRLEMWLQNPKVRSIVKYMCINCSTVYDCCFNSLFTNGGSQSDSAVTRIASQISESAFNSQS